MTQFLSEHHLLGLSIGIATFLIIGLFHPIVIKTEYHWGTRPWWVFLIIGLSAIAACIIVDDAFLSPLLGVVGFSSLWSIKELFEQRQRVAKGWFPRNPRRGS